MALAGVAQWIELQPANQRVTGSIPSQGTCLGCGTGARGNHGICLSHISVQLPLEHPPPGAWPATQARALTGNQTSNPLVHRLALSPLSHTSQG